jgi:hypothetical protein
MTPLKSRLKGVVTRIVSQDVAQIVPHKAYGTAPPAAILFLLRLLSPT